MKAIKTVVISIVAIIFLCLSLSACSSNDVTEETTNATSSIDIERVDGATGYRETLVDIESPEYNSVVQTVLYQEEKYYAIIDNHDKESGDIVSTNIYSICSSGEIDNNSQLEVNNSYLYLILGEDLLAVSSNKVSFLSLEDGSLSREEDIPLNPTAIAAYGDGFVLMYSGQIIYFNSECEEISRIENSDFLFFSPLYNSLYEIDSHLILVVSPGYQVQYYEINLDSGYCQYLGNNEDYSVEFSECFGEYIFDEIGEYKLNPVTGDKILLAEWSNTNIRPEYVTIQYLLNIGVDDCHFIKAYTGIGGTVSIQIYTYDPTIDYSDRTVITIGGFGLEYEYILKKNVYEYNMLQDEYRIVLNDFENIANSYEESVNQNLALISEFSSGNAPDIYFGNSFDYDYFGRNEMVIDMLPYLLVNERFNQDDIEPSLWNLMSHNDKCYQLFYSYAFNGYWGKNSIMSDYTNMTYSEMFNLSNENGIVCPSNYSTDIATFIIYYSINNLINENGELIVNRDEFEDVVRTSLEYGFPQSTSWDLLEEEGFSHLVNNEYLMTWDFIYNFEQYNDVVQNVGEDLCYIGFPSVFGSSHMIYPIGNVAVSSSSLYPEVCVDFLSYMFTSEMQEEIVLTGGNSVSSSIISNYSDSYREIIDSVDCIQIYDFSIAQIISEEISSYETQGKSIELITDVLLERLNTYLSENYG